MDGPPRRPRRALRGRARPQRRHAPFARQHPLRPVPPRARREGQRGLPLPAAEQETLATLLAGRGYRTAAFVSAFPLASRFGLGRGFEVYEDAFVGARPRPAFVEQERPGPETVALARRWVEAQRGQPFFCWVHIFEPHYPYAPPEPFASRFRGDPYHGEVAAADAALAPLLEPLLAAGDRGRTLVVLTADHGESLGEHGERTHGIFAYEATLRVPLILYGPRLFDARRVSAPARHVDLLPTILDALSLPVPEGLPGRSLLPLAAGEPGLSDHELLRGALGTAQPGLGPPHGRHPGRTKYIDLPIPELFELQSDAQESRNLAGHLPERLEEMRGLLAPLRSADRGIDRRPENAETQERLRSLGYVAGGRPRARALYRGRRPQASDRARRLAGGSRGPLLLGRSPGCRSALPRARSAAPADAALVALPRPPPT